MAQSHLSLKSYQNLDHSKAHQDTAHQTGEFFALKGYSQTEDVSRHFTVHNFEKNGDHIVFIIDGIHHETRQPF